MNNRQREQPLAVFLYDMDQSVFSENDSCSRSKNFCEACDNTCYFFHARSMPAPGHPASGRKQSPLVSIVFTSLSRHTA